MTVITKAGLAAELRVSKARVSQYLKRGLPQLANGKIEREVAVKWISENFPAYGRERATGVKRAGEIAKAVKRKPAPSAEPAANVDVEDLVDAALVDATAEIVSRVGPIVAAMAIELGLPCATAYALQVMTFDELATSADGFLAGLELDEFEEGGVCTISGIASNRRTDWPALAEAAGEPVDHDTWWAALDALPWSQRTNEAQPQMRSA